MSAKVGVLGTFDTKSSELIFIASAIRQRGLIPITINVGTRHPITVQVDYDLFPMLSASFETRDNRIKKMIELGCNLVEALYSKGSLHGIISVGGGTGTYLGTEIMKSLPFGVPKVMVSTVASRDMSRTVGTKDIMMFHSVFDMLGVTSLSSLLLEEAAASVCAMAETFHNTKIEKTKKRIALTMFGFITQGAERVREVLENRGYEVIPFHANGTGGMAMEELSQAGLFDGIIDLATHELADQLLGGYCGGITESRLRNQLSNPPPRVVVPGGLDCAVLQFTRDSIPPEFKDRQIFFYDFRSGIRLNEEETRTIALRLASKLNTFGKKVLFVVPEKGWSEADIQGGPLYNPAMNQLLINILKSHLSPEVEMVSYDLHINDQEFAQRVVDHMETMLAKDPGDRGTGP